jgi:hypothetical protein
MLLLGYYVIARILCYCWDTMLLLGYYVIARILCYC